MARNSPLLPRPRRGARSVREKTVASILGPGAVAPEDPSAARVPEDLRTVYGWLTRLGTEPAEIERLLVEIVRLARTSRPASVRAASYETRLQFLTVCSVLRQRGVL